METTGMARQPQPWRRKAKGNAWYAQVDGRQRWLAPREATKTDAHKALARLLAEEKPAAAPSGAALTVDELLRLYLASYLTEVKRGQKAQHSYDVRRWFLRSAAASFGAVAAAELTPEAVMTWAARPDWGTSTRGAAVRGVKAALAWAKRAKHLAANPLAELRAPKSLVREEIPSEANTGRVLEAATSPFREFLFALLQTGCRPGEAAQLTAAQVDLEAGVWRVPNKTRGQTGTQTRVIYLTAAMVALSRQLVARYPKGQLFRNAAGRAWNRGAVSARLVAIRDKLELGPEVISYACRHDFATRALAAEVPIATVATLLGHTSTDMVMRVYSKLKRERDHLREAAEKASKAS